MMPAAMKQQIQLTICCRRVSVSASSTSRSAAFNNSAAEGFQALKCSSFSRWRALVMAVKRVSIVERRIGNAALLGRAPGDKSGPLRGGCFARRRYFLGPRSLAEICHGEQRGGLRTGFEQDRRVDGCDLHEEKS